MNKVNIEIKRKCLLFVLRSNGTLDSRLDTFSLHRDSRTNIQTMAMYVRHIWCHANQRSYCRTSADAYRHINKVRSGTNTAESHWNNRYKLHMHTFYRVSFQQSIYARTERSCAIDTASRLGVCDAAVSCRCIYVTANFYYFVYVCVCACLLYTFGHV